MSEGAVRNGVLGRLVTTATGWQPVFTVPTGQTVLLKGLHAFNDSAIAAQLVVRMVASAGSVTAYLPPMDLEANGIEVWEGWTALNPADQLQVVSQTGPGGAPTAGVHVWVVGAALPGQLLLLPIGDLVELGATRGSLVPRGAGGTKRTGPAGATPRRRGD